MAGLGGARPGAGRKPKDEENRIRDLMMPYSLDAIQCLANIVVSDKSKDTDKISASKIIIEYSYGKPKERVESDVTINTTTLKDLINFGNTES
tara:strand:+ start:321 stop:599 length:279 start_codon:yes stop_codon:yes gene_type:complete